MQYIKAPSRDEAAFPSVFLAGGITNCPDWQSEIAQKLEAANITVFNPRRDAFPQDPAAVEEQIHWEFEKLRRADLISFWFDQGSLEPITLLEFGAAMERQQPLVVGLHRKYQREIDVEIQLKLRRPEIAPVYSLKELATLILQFFGQKAVV